MMRLLRCRDACMVLVWKFNRKHVPYLAIMVAVGATPWVWGAVFSHYDAEPEPVAEPDPVPPATPAAQPDPAPPVQQTVAWYAADTPIGWVFRDESVSGALWADTVMAGVSAGTVGASSTHTYTDPVSLRESFIPTQITVAATPTLLSLEEYEGFESGMLEMMESVYGMEVSKTDHGMVSVSGLPGTLTEYGVSSPEMTVRMRSAIALADGVLYSIGLAAEGGRYAAAVPLFERVVESFVIIPEGAPGRPPVWDDAGLLGMQACGGQAGCFTGVVSRVVDGDTIDVDGVRVRLALVDAAELGTADGAAAAAFAGSVCGVGSVATVDEDDGQQSGSHGRMVGEVWCGGRSLNGELVDAGHAGILTAYCQASEFSTRPWAACR